MLNDDVEVHFRSSERRRFFEATRIYKHGTPSGVQILQVQPTTEVINTRHVMAASRSKLKDHLCERWSFVFGDNPNRSLSTWRFGQNN